MKRFHEMMKVRLLSVVALLMLGASACADSKEEDVKPKPETKLELSIEIAGITDSAIQATITPSDNEATYYAAIHTVEEVGEDQGAALAQQLVASEGFASKLIRGTQTIAAIELEAETRYYVVAFGYDPAKQKFTGDVTLKEATTQEGVEKPEYLYTIQLTLEEGSKTWRDAVIQVEPSSEETTWIIDICTKELFDSRYAGNPAAIIEDNIKVWKSDAATFEDDPENWPDYMKIYWKQGTQRLAASEIRNLYWGEEYYAYCFAINEKGEQTSEIVTLPFSTSTPTPSSNEISIKINQTDQSSVDFTVETTNEDPYFVSIQTTDYLARFGEGKEETMEDLIFDLTYSKTEEQLQATVFSGTQHLTNADLNKSINGFKEYKVVIWGFDNGPTTQVICSEPFQPGTTHQPKPENAFEVAISNPTWCNASVDVTLLAETKYIWGGFTKEVWEADYASNLQAVYDRHKSIWENDAYYYGGTWQEQIQYYCIEGNKSEEDATNIIGAARLDWDTEYVIYLFGIDETSGEMTTEVESFSFSTTAPTPSTNELSVTILSTDRSSVSFTVNTTNNDPYYVTIEKKSSVDSWGDDVIKKTIPEYDNQLERGTFTGTQTLTQNDLGKTVNGFSEYYVIVYGFDNGPTTAVTLSEPFQPGVTHQPQPENAFEVAISNPTWCNASVDVTLLTETKYIWGGFTKEVWEADYASNLQAVYDHHKSIWENDAYYYGGTWQEQIQYYCIEGNKSEEDATNIIGTSRLNWDTEYVIYLFGIDETSGEMTTEVESFSFSTAAPTPSTNSFTISIDAMTKSSVEFTITPTTDDPYYVTIEKKSSVDSWGDDVIKKTIPEYDNQLERGTFTGTQTLTQSDLGKTVNGFSEYYVIVYGFDNGPTTAVTLSEPFKPAD